jgi:hypothetical protein
MKAIISTVCIVLFCCLYSCTTLDKYDLVKDKLASGGDTIYQPVFEQLGVLDASLNTMMTKYNSYADEYENLNKFDRGIDFTISFYFLSINTTASIYNYNGQITKADQIFGIGNILGTAFLTVQTLLKATFYEQRKKQLENKMESINGAITRARTSFLSIDNFSVVDDELLKLKANILLINRDLNSVLVNDIQPAFNK